MAAVQCSRCTAERRGFRQKLDSWRYKLIHCVGLESILEGIYGSMLMRDLNLFDDCEPAELDDWSPGSSVSLCTFCNLSLDKLTDPAPSAVSPLSSPSDYSPCQLPTLSESSQRAHKFLQSVFLKKDVNAGTDPSIPLIAQELMKKMIHKFAMEYATKCLLDTSASLKTGESSPSPETFDGPLDLTVGRVQGVQENEPEPDAILDLSKRNPTQSATGGSNDKSSGCCQPSDLGRRQKDHHKNSPLNAVLSSLCPAHGSLLYQMLKLAQREGLLSDVDPNRSEFQPYCCCAHLPEVTIQLPLVTGKCGAHDCSQPFPLTEDDQGDCNCLTHQFPMKRSESESPFVSTHCCMETCGTEMCPKSWQYLHCKSEAREHNCQMVASELFNHPHSLNMAPSVCCNNTNPHPNSRSTHSCKSQMVKKIKEEVVLDDSQCPILKREPSPSPPPLSPVSSDIRMKSHEKAPCLRHEDARLSVKDPVNSCYQKECLDSTKEESECPLWAAHIPSGTSLQDVMFRFSEKLDTISPLDKEQPPASDKNWASSVPLNQKSHFRADTHLTEIITTVLHTGSASDYNLSELFNRQDNKEAVSPNTRARCRQKVLAAIAKPPNDASSRRQTLNIKRELAQLYNRKQASKGTWGKNGSHIEAETKEKMEEPKISTRDKIEKGESTQGNNVHFTGSGYRCSKAEETLLTERKDSESDSDYQEDFQKGVASETESRRSRRNIVPPQRFSSYVTEPRKMFFVACFSENIFNLRSQEDKVLPPVSEDKDTSSTVTLSGSENSSETQLNTLDPPFSSISSFQSPKHPEVSHCQIKPSMNSPESENRSFKTIRTSPRRQKNKSLDMDSSAAACEYSTSPVQYTSPIKLMLVSPMKDKKGVIYSLKTAPSLSDANLREPFDPCVESSWSGTERTEQCGTRRLKLVPSSMRSTTLCETSSSLSKSPLSMTTKTRSSPAKTPSSPAKTASSPAKTRSSPAKTPSLPAKTRSSPAKTASSLAKTPSSPAKTRSSPAKSPSSPAKTRSSPAKSPSSPAKSPSSPAKTPSSPAKTPSSPAKTPSSPAKTRSSPAKTRSSPAKSPLTPVSSSASPAKLPISPKSASPNPRSKTSCDFSPANRTLPGRSCQDSTPKRRPGRPKKLRPQLETKIKRPIGRPRKQISSQTDSKVADKTNIEVNDLLNNNLKITVVYGRSRRNKRTVSESFDPLKIEFKDACHKGVKSVAQSSSHFKSATRNSLEDINNRKVLKVPLLRNPKESDAQPARKPGRPAKIKVSGISVTVATASPKQRKIKLKKEPVESPEEVNQNRPTTTKFTKSTYLTTRWSEQSNAQHQEVVENKEIPKIRPAPIRHSIRVRKPSIYFLHAVATSSAKSCRHSSALLRRSKQLLLNKPSNGVKQVQQQSCVDESEKICGQKKMASLDFNKMDEVSVDSIFTCRDPMRWWAASTEADALNQRLVQQIHLMSGSWVSVNSTNEGKGPKTKASSDEESEVKPSPLARTLFESQPDAPWTCSKQQLRSWFMQTTETKSLNITKKTSSRNPYEEMHFSRPVNKKRTCSSPQAERLRKHVKKFAKTVPQSPSQHSDAQRRLKISRKQHGVRRKLFTHKRQADVANREWGTWKYQMILSRARTLFLTIKERIVWLKKRQNKKSKKASNLVKTDRLKHRRGRCEQEPSDANKEPKYCTDKAWSPETLKDCRVFLKKINPAHHQTPEKHHSGTVTKDERSAEHRQRRPLTDNKAVNRKRMRTRNTSTSALEHGQRPEARQKCKSRSPVSSEPPAKIIRQSRLRGLTGPRWCDYVLGNYLDS